MKGELSKETRLQTSVTRLKKGSEKLREVIIEHKKIVKENSMTTINILSTGGTFDKAYGSGAGVKNFSFPKTSAVEEIVARLGITNIKVSYEPDRAKDSLDMGDIDRAFIADWCATHEHSVVIHGTDTMIDTARVVAQRCPDKVVILTGALQPARMRDTDAEFNLGGAIIAAQASAPGVYIVMSGTIYSWDKCKKNPTTGHFEPA